MWRGDWLRNWRRRSRFRSSSSSFSILPLRHHPSYPIPPQSSFPRSISTSFAHMPLPTQFDHEKLEVYQLELEFLTWVTDLLIEVRATQQPHLRETFDQLDRASLSSLLNTAEGNGKRATQQRARYFDDARGSAMECAACLDALVAKRATTKLRIASGKALLIRVVSILCKLIERFDGAALNSLPTESRTSRRTSTRTKPGGYEHG